MFDDNAAIVKNRDVTDTNRSMSINIGEIFRHDFWGQNFTRHSHKSFRPLTTVTFYLEYSAYGVDRVSLLPRSMKLFNFVLHIATCWMMYEAIRFAFRSCSQIILQRAIYLFAVHPIHTEVICSVVGRTDLLCALFYFATFIVYLGLMQGLSPFSSYDFVR